MIFRFDTNSPYAYLAALRVDDVVGPGVEWEPIAFAFLLRAQRRTPWSMTDGDRERGQEEIARRAQERGLPPVVYPEGWPAGSYALEPLRALTAAKAHGRVRPLALALYQRNFVTGEGLKRPGAVGECWAQAGLDPAAYDDALKAAKAPLVEATERAIAEEVPGVPTLTVAGRHFWGDDRLEDAAAMRG